MRERLRCHRDECDPDPLLRDALPVTCEWCVWHSATPGPPPENLRHLSGGWHLSPSTRVTFVGHALALTSSAREAPWHRGEEGPLGCLPWALSVPSFIFFPLVSFLFWDFLFTFLSFLLSRIPCSLFRVVLSFSFSFPSARDLTFSSTFTAFGKEGV